MVVHLGVDEVLKALGSGVRRRILAELYARGRLRYSELMRATGIEQSGWFAHHLKLLLSAGLVKRDASGKYYLSSLGRRAVLLIEEIERGGEGIPVKLVESISKMAPLDEVKATWGLVALVYAVSLASLPGWLKLLSLPPALASLALYTSLARSLKSLYCLPLFFNVYWVLVKPARWKPTLASMACGMASALALASYMEWRLALPLGIGLLALAALASYLGYRSAGEAPR